MAVRGYDSLSKKLNETLPPLAVKSLSAFLSEEALAKNDATAWNRRIGRFLGQSAKLGDVWTATDQTSLPTGGAVFYYSAAKLAEQVKYEGVNCVRILYSYNTDPVALKDFLGKTVNDIVETSGIPELKLEVTGLEINGRGERLIDPSNMLIYSETTAITMNFEMEFPELGKVKGTVEDKVEYSFDYPK